MVFCSYSTTGYVLEVSGPDKFSNLSHAARSREGITGEDRVPLTDPGL